MTVRGRCVVGAAAGHRGGGRGRRFLDSAPRRHRHAAQHAAPARHVCTQRGTPKALTTRWNSGSRADSRLAAVAGVGGSSEGEDGAHGGGAHSSGRADSHAAPVTYGEDYGTILNIAVPAFFSLMLDPLMAAVDAGVAPHCRALGVVCLPTPCHALPLRDSTPPHFAGLTGRSILVALWRSCHPPSRSHRGPAGPYRNGRHRYQQHGLQL